MTVSFGPVSNPFTLFPLQLKVVHEGAFHAPDGTKPDPNLKIKRNLFITKADIRAIQVGIEAEEVRLAKDDASSTLAWVERLRAEGSLLGFKAVADLAPEGSGMPADTFFLAIQTPWQQSIHDEVAEYVLCIDGTHNTTQYYNCNLYTILGRNKWGHGE